MSLNKKLRMIQSNKATIEHKLVDGLGNPHLFKNLQ